MTQKIKWENSPPPSDFEFDDIEISTFFTFPRPQLVNAPPFISIDLSLIHPSLLGYESSKSPEKINETVQEDANNNATEIVDESLKEVEQIKASKNKEINLVAVTEENTNINDTHKKKAKALKETENCSKVKDKSTCVSQKGDHVCAAHEKKRRKHSKRNTSKREQITIDSDNESIIISNGVEISKIKSLSKESKTAARDPNYSKPTPRKYFKSKNSKRIPVSDDDESSNSDRSKISQIYARKCKKYKSIAVDGDQNLSYRSKTSYNSHNKPSRKSPEIKVKQEIFSEEEESIYVRKIESFSRGRLSESDGSPDNLVYNGSRRKRCHDDDRSSDWSSPKREIKQEIKCDPGNAEDGKECHGPDVFYCTFCKLSLNSELTWNSHLLGKRHARAIRAQSVCEVAKSSLIPATFVPISEEGRRHDKPPPGIERKELKNAVSSIQEVCDGLRDKQAVGLKHVWEIRNEAETVYYCNLCDSPCAPSSVMLHITGYKHRLQCLKEYFPQDYARFKDAHKKKLDSIMDAKFYKHERIFRKERVRVFKDIPIANYKKSSAYPFDQPGPSWQGSSQIKLETLTIKDENGKPVVPSNQEFLNTKYADFHCTVCDSHMNNIQMWEAHIRGKRHLKNLKKGPQGLEPTNKYVEAPSGTVSNLERQIKDVCGYNDIIVGLNYIRECQGKQGNQYNCYPCGGCCSDIDIIDHILAMKHKIKILEKMHFDGIQNSIMEINSIQISTYYREQMVNDECLRMVEKHGRGKPQVYYIKRDLRDYEALRT